MRKSVLIVAFLLVLQLFCFGSVEAKFVKVGKTHEYRIGHTATLLDDGRVLIVGGRTSGMSAEIYDPKTRKFSMLPGLNAFRKYHSAVKLKDGRVLIVGGYEPTPSWLVADKATDIAEIFDPKTNQFIRSTPFPKKMSFGSAILLEDGRVCILSGSDIYMYYPDKDIYEKWGHTILRRSSATMALLDNNTLFIVGGSIDKNYDPLHNAEVFDLLSGKSRLI